MTYGDGQFIAAGTNGLIFSSATGTNWTQANPGVFANLRNLIWANDTFVAVGEQGTILTSSNGSDWTSQNSGVTNSLFGVAFGASRFVAVGYQGAVVSSGDGVHWTNQISGTTLAFLGVAYGNGLFVEAGNGIYTSPDAVSWVKQYTTNYIFESVAFVNGTFMAVGDSIRFVMSPDGTNWTPQTVGLPGGSLYTAAYGNGQYVANGFPGTYFRTSADGVNWTNQSSGFPGSVSGIAFANGTFVAAADAGTILTSPDSIAWATRPRKSWKNLWGVAYGNGTYVLAGDSGTILQSDSAIIPTLKAVYSPEQHAMCLYLTGEVGRRYRIQASGDPASGGWQDIFITTNIAPVMQLTDPSDLPQRFYRAATP